MDSAIIIRGGPNFDPVKYVRRWVTWSICMPTHFWSTPISHRNLWSRDSICSKTPTFDPVRTNEGGSKVGFRTNWVTLSLISKRNWGGSKVSRNAYASRDYLLHILYWVKRWTLAYHCFRNVRCNFVLVGIILDAQNDELKIFWVYERFGEIPSYFWVIRIMNITIFYIS